MTRLQFRLPILLLCASFALACGDYSGGGGSSEQGNVIVGGGSGLGGLNQSEQVSAFTGTVYPLLSEHCSDCHAGFGPGTPHIAHSNPAVAYSSVVDNQKVNFSLPESSRLVRRLATDFHYCWSACAANGAEMLAAVQAWDAMLESAGAGGGDGGSVDVAALVSDTLDFQTCFGAGSCEENEGGERYDERIIARWEFKELTGGTAYDTSGVAPAMDLTLSPGVELMSSYGIDVESGGVAMADAATSRKLFDRIASSNGGSGAYSVEAWVVPGNVTQEGESGPSRIVSYSRGNGNANFTLGQRQYQYAFRNRTVNEDVNNRGEPTMLTYDVDEDLQATLQHVVITYDRFRGRMFYVDGVWTDDVDEQPTARLWNWDDRNMLALGNETTGTGNEWIGQIRFLAIHDRALSASQIKLNYEAGVGKRLTLRFDISQWAGAGTTIEFAFTELDNYSYLFCQPTIRGPNPAGITVDNIRIQVNGTIPVEGQAFTRVNDTVLLNGHQLSRQCSVIRKEFGVDQDQFTVAFEQLGVFQSPLAVNSPDYVVPTNVLDPVPVLGIRDFARINQTLAALTGVDPLTPEVDAVYQEITQQLPNSQDIRSFVSSHQVGISKLSFEYCNAMVEDTALRDAWFDPSFQWNEVPSVAFDSAAKIDLITEPLISGMLRHGAPGQALPSQPDFAAVEGELDLLITDLMVCNLSPCDAERTVNIVKGVCTAALASAGVMVH